MGSLRLCLGISSVVGRNFCCVSKHLLYHLSPALDADLHYALESCPENDIGRRCLVYVHKIINAKAERQKGPVKIQLQSKLEVKAMCSRCTTDPTTFPCFSPSLLTRLLYTITQLRLSSRQPNIHSNNNNLIAVSTDF